MPWEWDGKAEGRKGKGVFCFLLFVTDSQVTGQDSGMIDRDSRNSMAIRDRVNWFLSDSFQLVKLNKRPPSIGRPGECVIFLRKSMATFQMLCTICTLPGHLPCVHETSDFRQRKLVVETFGWLAFKEWFREPDFWR